MDDAVDDANGPALHYHWLGGFIGEKVCYTRPHPSSMCVTVVNTEIQFVCVFSVCYMTFRNKKQITKSFHYV